MTRRPQSPPQPIRTLDETERKFLLGIDAVDELLARFYAQGLSEEIHGEPGARAFARTTYLDTNDFALYRSSFTSARRRLRIREYASAPPGEAPRLTGRCFLELKTSSGTRRAKERYEAAPARVEEILEGLRPPDLPGGIEEVLDSYRLLPRMTTWYRRFSLANADASFRFTVDAEIQFCKPTQPRPAGEIATPPALSSIVEGCIAEVKFAGPAPSWLDRAIAGLPEAPDFSKFRAGMEKVLGLDHLGNR